MTNNGDTHLIARCCTISKDGLLIFATCVIKQHGKSLYLSIRAQVQMISSGVGLRHRPKENSCIWNSSSATSGLKALFRPMTVMVPDLVLICENMLMAEGFIEAKVRTMTCPELVLLFAAQSDAGRCVALIATKVRERIRITRVVISIL